MSVTGSELYFTDNGAVYCHDHLGACAKATGRDLSGQRIALVTAQDRLDALAFGYQIACETCSPIVPYTEVRA